MLFPTSSNGLQRLLKGSYSIFLQQLRPPAGPLPRGCSALTGDGSSGSNSGNQPPLTTPKLFISGLSRFTTDHKLKEAFAPFGQLLEANVATDRVTGRSKGFAFIKYASIAEAEKARQGMNGKFLDGWVIFVDPAKPRERKPPPLPETRQSETGIRVNKTVGWCG